MIKTWLITSSAPFCGTDSYYGAYAKENPIDWLYEHWFDEECQELWDSYSFHCTDQWQDEWNEMNEDEKEEVFDNDYDCFMDYKYEEWCADCGLKVEECPEEDFSMYVPEGNLEIVYDERSK